MFPDVQHLVAALSVGSSATMIAIQIIEDGASPSLGVQGALLGGAVAVFFFFDRREQKAARERNEERRTNDKIKDERITELEREAREHIAEIRDLNREIRDLLRGGR